MAEGDNKTNQRGNRNPKNAANAPTQNPKTTRSNGRPSEPDGGFDDDLEGSYDEGFAQEGGTERATRRYRVKTFLLLGVIVLGALGLAASFLLRDDTIPAPSKITPGATLFVTLAPTRTPRAPATPQPAATFPPIAIQRADTPRLALHEVNLAEGTYGRKLNLADARSTGLYSYDGRWLATFDAEGASLTLTDGQDGTTKPFDTPTLAGGDPHVYLWSPDNTTLLVTAGFSQTSTVPRQIAMVRLDAASDSLAVTTLPISTSLEALTLSTAGQTNLDEVAQPALAYWSPDSSRLAIIANATLDDPPYNADGTPRFRKQIQLFDRAGAPLGQFETSSDCCYWTGRNELLWWDARDPNTPEYVFHQLRVDDAVTNIEQATSEVRVPVQDAPNGLWLIGSDPFFNEQRGAVQFLGVTLGSNKRLVRVNFDDRTAIPLLDRIERVTSAFASPDVPITALDLTRIGADNNLWFYDWTGVDANTNVPGTLIAGGQVQHLGSWDDRLRGFTGIIGPSRQSAVELLDVPSSQTQINYATPPQNLRAEMSVLRPWPVNRIGDNFGATRSTAVGDTSISPDGRWQARIQPLIDGYNLYDIPPTWWTTVPADAPIAELRVTDLTSPTLVFTQVVTLADGAPALTQWAPDSRAVSFGTLTRTGGLENLFLIQTPLSERDEFASATVALTQTDTNLGQAIPFPTWSQNGNEIIVLSRGSWRILDVEGQERLQVPWELDDRAPAFLDGNLMLIRQGVVLQKIDLRDPALERQTVYTWTTDLANVNAGRLTVLGANANHADVLVAESILFDSPNTAIKRVNLESGATTTIAEFSENGCCTVFSAGPSNQPILGISRHSNTRVLDTDIWFYDWNTGTLYNYDRPAKLLGWDPISKSFLLARRGDDVFQVEAMQPLIQ